MAAVVKGLTHLAVNQAFASSILVSRPILEKIIGNPMFFLTSLTYVDNPMVKYLYRINIGKNNAIQTYT